MIGLARIGLVLLLLGFAGGIAGCKPDGGASSSPRAAAPGDDAALWQGDWKLVSATHAGKTDVLDGGWQVHGDRYDVTLGGKTDEHWQFTLDPGAKQFESQATWGPTGSHQDYLVATGNTDQTCVCRMRGLYEVSPTSLRVVFDPTGREYPRSFDIPPGSLFTIYVFQREDS
jgi:uncharacterized protein (TIGR03067 family)